MDESSAKAALDETAPSKSSGDIWLVNDDPAQLMVQKRLLSRFCTSVTSFLSPLEALASARSVPSSPLLVTDFHMPGMDGPELAQFWCDLHDQARVLVVSASELSSKERIKVEKLPAERVKVLTSYRIAELKDQAQGWFEHSPRSDSRAHSVEDANLSKNSQRFDKSVLAKLSHLGGATFVTRTVARFVVNTPQKVTLIEEAFQEKDLSKMHATSHSLKGSCGLVGATALLAIADRLETATDPDRSDPLDFDTLRSTMVDLRKECTSTVQELEDSSKK